MIEILKKNTKAVDEIIHNGGTFVSDVVRYPMELDVEYL